MQPMDLSTYNKFVDADIEHMRGIDHLLLSCNMNKLIESIYVSPWAEDGYMDEIKDLLYKYHLDKNVKKSFYHGNLDKNGRILDV